ncbi:hypothetical protein OHC33_010236 [Knufia fluminis]|uniref:Uncharacterized protein n=1 Tax=Knufia fluminis TaxID=191047 RepID=A0AAN8I1E4_9EURO|nr:hypothetical protein OHC33_010236 [Knufia fluminis]
MPITAFLSSPSPLALLTTAIGTGGLTVGIYSFINPTAAARIYGVPVTIPSTTLTNILCSSSSSSTATSEAATLESRDLSFIHALGIRNLTTGLSVLVLSGYWHITLSTSSHEVRQAVQRALGIVILVGALVPIVDAWVCWTASREFAEALTKKSKAGDMKVGDVTNEAVEVGRRAGNLHAMRSLVWLAGALWCLFG